MAMNPELMKAILAMDAYNRGYNAGIKFGTDPNNSTAIDGVTQVGNAVVYQSANSSAAQDISFYAIAYEYGGKTVISYRGTDDFSLLGGDPYYGWGVGLGSAAGPQALMAFDFYNVVKACTACDISLTGHSMGGGLAGLVSAVTGVEGILFDNMALRGRSSKPEGRWRPLSFLSGSLCRSICNP